MNKSVRQVLDVARKQRLLVKASYYAVVNIGIFSNVKEPIRQEVEDEISKKPSP
jgi:hypothetical protein